MRYNIWTIKDHVLPSGEGFSYSNTYRVEAADLSAAYALSVDLVTWEQAVLSSRVLISRVRIRTDAEDVGDGFTWSPFLHGSRVYPIGDNGIVEWSVIVNLTAAGRWVGRKWLRPGLMPDDLVDGDLDPAYVSLVQSSYAAPLAAATVYRTRADVVIDGARVDPHLRLREMRRGTFSRAVLVI